MDYTVSFSSFTQYTYLQVFVCLVTKLKVLGYVFGLIYITVVRAGYVRPSALVSLTNYNNIYFKNFFQKIEGFMF